MPHKEIKKRSSGPSKWVVRTATQHQHRVNPYFLFVVRRLLFNLLNEISIIWLNNNDAHSRKLWLLYAAFLCAMKFQRRFFVVMVDLLKKVSTRQTEIIKISKVGSISETDFTFSHLQQSRAWNIKAKWWCKYSWSEFYSFEILKHHLVRAINKKPISITLQTLWVCMSIKN